MSFIVILKQRKTDHHLGGLSTYLGGATATNGEHPT